MNYKSFFHHIADTVVFSICAGTGAAEFVP